VYVYPFHSEVGWVQVPLQVLAVRLATLPWFLEHDLRA
jgi:hypothetical protein